MDKGEPARDDAERLERLLAWQEAFNRRRAHRRRRLVVAGTAALGVALTILIATLLARFFFEPDRAVERPGALKQATVATSSESPPKPPAINRKVAGKGPIGEAQPAAERAPIVKERLVKESPPGDASPVPRQPRAAVRDTGRAKPHAVSPLPRPVSAVTAETSMPAAAVPGPPPPRVDPASSALVGEKVVATPTPVSSSSPAGTPGMPAGPGVDTAKDSRGRPIEIVKRVVDYVSEMRPGEAIERWMKTHPPAGDADSAPLKRGPAEAP
jgi:hypothetical protein